MEGVSSARASQHAEVKLEIFKPLQVGVKEQPEEAE